MASASECPICLTNHQPGAFCPEHDRAVHTQEAHALRLEARIKELEALLEGRQKSFFQGCTLQDIDGIPAAVFTFDHKGAGFFRYAVMLPRDAVTPRYLAQQFTRLAGKLKDLEDLK